MNKIEPLTLENVVRDLTKVHCTKSEIRRIVKTFVKQAYEDGFDSGFNQALGSPAMGKERKKARESTFDEILALPEMGELSRSMKEAMDGDSFWEMGLGSYYKKATSLVQAIEEMRSK